MPPIPPAPAPTSTVFATPNPDEVYASSGKIQGDYATPAQVVARPASAQQQEVLFVPLAISIGDGFKFGCGFFLALVLVMLIGFVLLAALFALTSLFGLNLPITR